MRLVGKMSEHAGKGGKRRARSGSSGQGRSSDKGAAHSATLRVTAGATGHDANDTRAGASDGNRQPGGHEAQGRRIRQDTHDQVHAERKQGKHNKQAISTRTPAGGSPMRVASAPAPARRKPHAQPHLISSGSPGFRSSSTQATASATPTGADGADSVTPTPHDGSSQSFPLPVASAATDPDTVTNAAISRDAGDADDSQIIQLELNDLAYGGDAVGRFEGRAIFVAGGLPGELVRARLTRERSSYARASLVEVLRSSPDRVAPRYPDLADSGGFQWQHLAYPAQVAWKSRIVRQLLMRVGHFANPSVLPTLGMPANADPWRSRTVAQFAIGPAGEIGFRRMESHAVIDMPTCPIVHPALDALYQQVRGWLRSNWGADAADYVERFTLRVAIAAPGGRASINGAPGGQEQEQEQEQGQDDQDTYRDAEVGLLTLEARPGGAIDAFGGPEAVGAAICAAAPGLVGVVVLGMAGGRGRVVVGQDFVHERVLHRRFRISAGSFFQVNPTQTPTLVRTALAALHPAAGDWALDGYSGVGLFSLFLAEHVTHVRAIESQPSAVADARASAILNGVGNISITEGVLERMLGELRAQHEHADLALVDPPRSGCHPRALAEITANLRPRRLVYVSCDPSTLARDLRLICDAGYSLTSVQPVDMFPFTAHIECVALCERVDE